MKEKKFVFVVNPLNNLVENVLCFADDMSKNEWIRRRGEDVKNMYFVDGSWCGSSPDNIIFSIKGWTCRAVKMISDIACYPVWHFTCVALPDELWHSFPLFYCRVCGFNKEWEEKFI